MQMSPIGAVVIDPVGCMAEFEAGAWTGIERLELEAVERAQLYEDVVPSLTELAALSVQLVVASSLSQTAVTSFLERHALAGFFAHVWTRDNAGGGAHVPLVRALEALSLDPSSVLFVTDTSEGLRAAKRAGLVPILMMNDPDQAMRLTTLDPVGGIVSLHELPDFVRLVEARR
jgi:beta-phosphoglucomutase-like phosphatase (HAD superfamily)